MTFELGRQVVDVVDLAGVVEYPLQLAIRPDVGPYHAFIVAVLELAAPHIVPAAAQLRDQRAAEGAPAACHKNPAHRAAILASGGPAVA